MSDDERRYLVIVKGRGNPIKIRASSFRWEGASERLVLLDQKGDAVAEFVRDDLVGWSLEDAYR